MLGSKPASRRSFLNAMLHGMGGVAAVTLLPSASLPTLSPRLDKLDQASFASRLHSSFRVSYAHGRSLAMSLIAVTDLRASPQQSGEVFSLLFETSAGQKLPQGTYVFQDRKLGTFSMFIVPASISGKHHRYEALFNRTTLA